VTSRNTQSGREGGFALIVALLALMLLTFLGLTLSATTSTELQISNNYRWSQQALYNAEAGLEVARVVLQRTGDGQLVLPETRSVTWDPSAVNTPTLPVARFAASRNFEGSACDNFGKGAGYGAVLTDPNDAANPLQKSCHCVPSGLAHAANQQPVLRYPARLPTPLVINEKSACPRARQATFTRWLM